jgi:hypothetical protein
MGRTTKKQIEAEAARCFCMAFEASQEVSARVLRAGEDPPDFYVQIAHREVAMELAGYREQGAHNNSHDRDEQVKLEVRRAWEVGGDINFWTPCFRWKEREAGFQVPQKPADIASLIVETKALIQRQKAVVADQFIDVIFKPLETIEMYRQVNSRDVYAVASEFPVLSRFCTEVNLQYHPGCRVTVPSSNMNARNTGIDREELTKVLMSKLGKLASYRVVAGERPLWLLLYGLFWPPTARIPHSGLVPEVIEHLQSVLAGATERFDAIWWGQELDVDIRSIHRVA